MSSLDRRLGCLALVLVIGGCGPASGTGQPVTAAAPSVTASLTIDEPSGSATQGVRPLRKSGESEILDPGTYVLDQFPVNIAFDIPDGEPPGWFVGESNADSAIVLWFTPPKITYEFAFSTADNVYVDPCNAGAGELDPPIGPSLDDLVAAIVDLPRFQVAAPTDVTIGAFRGKEIELTALDSGSDCPEVIIFRAGSQDYDVFPGQMVRLQFLDIAGVPIVMRILEGAERDTAAEAELHQILDSIRIEPPS